ncbi:MAG: ATP-binding protein [Lachnospiraceae bacterium]|nr:ATP-binding protein [Lachnospiraceae bacterium]
MLLGRADELNYLNNCYDRDGSQILVMYGQKHIGKTTLVKEFMRDKPNHYYLARACSEREQVFQWGRQLVFDGYAMEPFPSFHNILAKIAYRSSGKSVIVIDEFQHIVKAGDRFMKELIAFVHSQWNRNGVMIVLCSSSVGWVENSMVTRIGEAAYELSGFLKIREMPFEDIVQRFPNFRIEECVEAYAILGGIPGLWNQFDDRLTIQQNICRNILDADSFLYEEGERILTEQLREPGVYNTIMASIAAGNYKLNDLYLHTGFSRAKISVYLKNLIELELVEKVFSYDTAGRENVQKGIYRLNHPFVNFYYTYMYPHMSDLQTLSVGEFYNRHVMGNFRKYVSGYFKRVCRQHLAGLNDRHRLPFVVDSIGEWIGKAGSLDIIAQDEEGHTLIGLCNWEKPMTYEDYENLLAYARKAKIQADYIYMYTAFRFDEKLNLEAKIRPNLKLVQITDL